MSQISDFFGALEGLLFELVTWVILIPKTLYLVLSHPAMVPAYVRGELSHTGESRARYEGTVSPVFLFLMVAIGPFLLIRVVDLPKVPISGETTGTVNSFYEFRADFSDVPEAYYTRSVWSIEPVGSAGSDWRPEPDHCFEGRTTRIDCADVADSIAWDSFFTMIFNEEKSVSDAHSELASKFSGAVADAVAAEWCGFEPGGLDLENCQGAVEAPGWAPADENAFDRFQELINRGETAAHARTVIESEFGEDAAQEIHDYWCSYPPGEGCETTAAYDLLVASLDEGRSLENAMEEISLHYGNEVAAEIADYWCEQLPPSEGCAARPAWDYFRQVIDGGQLAEEARRIVAVKHGPEVAGGIFDWWCAPPANQGCPEVGGPDDLASDFELAFYRFEELVAGGANARQAREDLEAEFGPDVAQEVHDIWCEPPAGPGCEASPIEPGMALTVATADSSNTMAPILPDDFVGDILKRRWDVPGRYRISLEVYDMESGSIIDISDAHEIEVRPQSGRKKADEEQEPKKDKKTAKKGGQESDSVAGSEKIAEWLKSPATAALALVFLVFPLILTLATELHRDRPLTQMTIKPAFYVQCLYLSPFIVSIWIPILLLRYSPRVDVQGELAVALAVVIFFWLVIAEIGFVKLERSISWFRAILWLAVPVGFILVLLFLALVAAGLHKYMIVEMVGTFVMTMMLVPFLASGIVRLWRRIFRYKNIRDTLN